MPCSSRRSSPSRRSSGRPRGGLAGDRQDCGSPAASPWCGATCPASSRMLARDPGIKDLGDDDERHPARSTPAALRGGPPRVNVAIDTLREGVRPDRPARLAARSWKGSKAIAAAGVRPLKINMVVCAASPTRTIPFAGFARPHGLQIRFIEFMPLDGDNAWSADQVLPAKELAKIHARVHPLESRRARTAIPPGSSGSRTGRGTSASSPGSPSRSASTATGSG